MTSVAFLCTSFLSLPPLVHPLSRRRDSDGSLDSRSKKHMVDGQESAAVRPTERKHTEAAGKLFSGMIIKTRKEFDLLGAATVVDGIIEDEDVDAIRARQGSDGGLDDGCSEQCGELAPMDVAGVHEAIEGILGKGEDTVLEVSLHEERAMCEDRREGDEEDAKARKAAMFVDICRAQNTADVVTPEEILQKIFGSVKKSL